MLRGAWCPAGVVQFPRPLTRAPCLADTVPGPASHLPSSGLELALGSYQQLLQQESAPGIQRMRCDDSPGEFCELTAHDRSPIRGGKLRAVQFQHSFRPVDLDTRAMTCHRRRRAQRDRTDDPSGMLRKHTDETAPITATYDLTYRADSSIQKIEDMRAEVKYWAALQPPRRAERASKHRARHERTPGPKRAEGGGLAQEFPGSRRVAPAKRQHRPDASIGCSVGQPPGPRQVRSQWLPQQDGQSRTDGHERELGLYGGRDGKGEGLGRPDQVTDPAEHWAAVCCGQGLRGIATPCPHPGKASMRAAGDRGREGRRRPWPCSDESDPYRFGAEAAHGSSASCR